MYLILENLKVIKHGTRRVLTTQQIADSYGTESKVISNNFNNNKGRYLEGKHYHNLIGDELKEFLQSSNLGVQNSNKIRSLYLWTEKGALLHAKSLNTDKAWEVYEQLVETYFKVQEENPLANLSPELKAIFMLDKKTQEFDSRVTLLENTMTIDYEQQEQLHRHARTRLIEILGGKGSPAYNMLSKKVFSNLWNRYKQVFHVSSYKNTAKKDFIQAIDYITKWEPTKEVRFMIIGANSQIEFNN